MASGTDDPRKDFDADGFLLNPSAWNEALARELARADGFGELTDDQWRVIRALRAHYQRFGAPPPMRHICHLNGMQRNCVEALFDHRSREAWRLAGLPNPGAEAIAYMH